MPVVMTRIPGKRGFRVSFFTTINRGEEELPLEVRGTYHRGTGPTYWEPGDPPELAIARVFHADTLKDLALSEQEETQVEENFFNEPELEEHNPHE